MDILKIKQSFPPLFGRQAVKDLLPGVISPKTLANLESLGQGPPFRRLGRKKVIYEKDSFFDWLLLRFDPEGRR
jgi:hypothetical protein